MNVMFAVHDAAGRILRSGQCSEYFVEHQAREGEMAIVIEEPVNDQFHYVNGIEIVPRMPLPNDFDKLTIFADGTDVATLSLPPGTATVIVDGTAHEVTDGVFEFVALVADNYTIEVRCWPWLDKTFVVKAI